MCNHSSIFHLAINAYVVAIYPCIDRELLPRNVQHAYAFQVLWTEITPLYVVLLHLISADI